MRTKLETRRGALANGPIPVRRGATRYRAAIVVLCAPFLALFTFVYVAPVVYSIVQSLFGKRTSGLGFDGFQTVFVGLENYRLVLAEPAFARGLLRVVGYGLVQVPLMTAFGVALALILDSLAARGVRFFRLAFFIPFAVPGVVATLMWGYMYNSRISPFIPITEAFGLDINFLSGELILWSIGNIVMWTTTGFIMLIVFSSLQGVPREIYESARVDGASEMRIALQLKLPMVKSALVLSITLSIIGTLQLFNEPTILKTAATSIDSSFTPLMMAYNAALKSSEPSYAAAVSVLVALLAGLLSWVFYTATTRRAS